MKKFAWIAGIAVVLAAAAAVALVISDRLVSGKWRYRITIAVETTEGVRTGSAVREVSAVTGLIRWYDGGGGVGVKGEAVVVDLGERGVLFGLIDWNSYDEFYDAFPYPKGGGQATADGIRYYNTLEPGRSAPLTNPKYWPQMVTFGDLHDPKSVKAVDPDDLAAAFGEGVSLKGITVEITDEPVTWEMDRVLPEYRAVPLVFGRSIFRRGGPRK
jgi:hypothetical protein